MPWQTEEISNLQKKAKSLIKEYLNLEINTNVYIVTEEEMRVEVLQEQKLLGRSEKELEIIQIELKYILGKYFSQKNQIWIVEVRGIELDVVIHEMIHSRQVCTPHREHIVDYVTFKITGNDKFIDNDTKKDWEEIERQNGLKKIVERLRKEGDCEEFD